MKTTIRLFMAIAITLLLFSTTLFAQDAAPAGPEYITVTTLHWNMDYEDFDREEWMAVEKEYLDKVTSKNEHIMGSGFYWHFYTSDNTELVYVQAYASWEDIDKSNDRNNELAEEAWPEEEARDAFFDKQSAYYDDYHSDEIYATLGGAKVMTAPPTEDMITYVRTSYLAYPDDGTQKEFNDLRNELIENTVNKNELIKAYYPNVHAWGSDRREFVEAIYVDSLVDLDKIFDRNEELIKEHWPDENDRKAFFKKMGKYFTGQHGDRIFTYINGLSK